MKEATLFPIEKYAARYRLVLLLGVAAALFLWREWALTPTAVAMILTYLVYVALTRFLLLQRYYSPHTPYIMLVVDVGVAIATLYIFKLENPVFLLLPLVVIGHGLYLGYAGGLASASLSAFSYAGLVYFLGKTSSLGISIAFQGPLLYLLAILTGYLAQQRFRERETQVTIQEIIRAESGAKYLLELARTLHSSLELEAVLKEVVRAAPSLTDIPHCIVFLLDREKLVARATNVDLKSYHVEDIDELAEIADEDPVARLAFASGQPVPLSGSGNLPDWIKRLGAKSFIACPLISQNQRLGVLYLLDLETQRNFNPEETQKAKGLADIAAMAIGDAQLYFRARERSSQLLSELRSIVQRMGRLKESHTKAPITLGELTLNPAKGEVSLSGEPISLSTIEFEVLYFLAENAGTPVNQETLLRQVWGEDYRGQTNVVDVTIHRLRRKLQRQPGGKDVIRTMRGAGYLIPRS
jgi:DNA-binding winged helix-turn-helix (wHTH) protein